MSTNALPKTFAEELSGSGCNTFADQILLAVNFFQETANISATRQDMEGAFTRWRLRLPSHIPQNIRVLVSRGLLDYREEREGQPTYIVTGSGHRRLVELARQAQGRGLQSPRYLELKESLSGVKDDHERELLLEALRCYDVGAYRASTVMTWAAVVRRLHILIDARGLARFNQAYNKRYSKDQITLKTEADLAFIDDAKLLAVCEEVRMFRVETLGLLKSAQKLRNIFAHPGDVEGSTNKANVLFEAALIMLKL